jgi:hypothetical protein
MSSRVKSFEELWDRVMRCDRCLRDPALATLQRDSFAPHRPMLPMPPNARSIPYLFVAMESSLDWAGTRANALALQRNGWRCFNNSPEDLTLQYAADRWLLRKGQGYAITDLGKCALPVRVANQTHRGRYANCAPWLLEEILVLSPRLLIAVGTKAFDELKRQRVEGWPGVAGVLHWSRQNTMNIHHFIQDGWDRGLPSEGLLGRWRRKAFDERSWHPEGDSHQRMAEYVTPYQMQLLSVYRSQFLAIRRIARNPTPAALAAARGVGVHLNGFADGQ